MKNLPKFRHFVSAHLCEQGLQTAVAEALAREIADKAYELLQEEPTTPLVYGPDDVDGPDHPGAKQH